MTRVVVELPGMRLVNISNTREHWSKRAKRTSAQRFAAWAATLKAIGTSDIAPPYVCTIVRIGPGKMDRSNIYVAAKACEDGICDALGVNDGDEANWTLTCTQEKPAKGGPKYGVRVELVGRSSSALAHTLPARLAACASWQVQRTEPHAEPHRRADGCVLRRGVAIWNSGSGHAASLCDSCAKAMCLR